MPLIFGRTSTGLMVPVRVDADGLLAAESLGYIGGAWQKNPLAFGYSGQVLQRVANTALAAGTNQLDSSAVPASTIWVITHLSMSYIGTVAGVVLYTSILAGGVDYGLFYQSGIASIQIYERQGWWVLAAGQQVRLTVLGATLNDDAYLVATGFSVSLAA